MCGVKNARMIWQRVSTHELAQELGLDSIDNYIYRRQLRWLGHVYCMGFERISRRMVAAWVAESRPPGGQLMTSCSRALLQQLCMSIAVGAVV